MKKGTKVSHIRRNGEKVVATVIDSWSSSRGDWVTLRVGDKGAAGSYSFHARPSQCIVKEK